MPNALAHEKSPYLLQHADNPVAWLPWGDAAFARARAEQKPIFLSIGYSTCHWCHVMAHESFENAATAAILNEHFVPVKVDREERPDVDKVYMAYVQAMTGHGGWPLSAWLTPALQPFFGGTYFPPEDRPGRAGFPTILRAIAHGWATEREKLVAEAERAIATLRQYYGGPGPEDEGGVQGDGGHRVEEKSLAVLAGEAFERGFQHLDEAFDAAHGGFGGAPKFPRASNLNFLFRVAALQGVTSEMGGAAVRLATATLRGMARGGIHDHVGGGYHRYSVDEGWFVPHFEKMLYDQAQIAVNCLEARQATGDERFAWMARDIFEYAARDLANPAGGYFTAEDADSAEGGAQRAEDGGQRMESGERGTEGGAGHAEGAFYVWTKAEIAAVLGSEGAVTPLPRPAEGAARARPPHDFFCAHFGVEEKGNVPAQLDPHGELRGKNILAAPRALAATAQEFSLTAEEANDRLLAALERLRGARARRPRPLLDDKVLTANNGLMISALAKAHQVLGSDVRSLTLAAAEVGAEIRSRALAATGAQPSGHERERVDYLASAQRTAAFIERELYDADRGVLFRTWRGSRGATEGFAEDYAFLIQGLLDLYEASFEVRWLQWAERLQQKMDELFWDPSDEPGRAGQGGYFNSSAHDPSIVLRLKEEYDGAEPAPSSVAAMNLLRLAAMLNLDPLRERGRRTIEAFRAQWTRAAQALPQMVCALELALEPPRHVVLAGDPAAADFRALASVLHERLGPRRILLGADGGAGQRWLAERAPWLAEMKPVGGCATAYVCEEFACRAPTGDPAELRRLLA